MSFLSPIQLSTKFGEDAEKDLRVDRRGIGATEGRNLFFSRWSLKDREILCRQDRRNMNMAAIWRAQGFRLLLITDLRGRDYLYIVFLIAAATGISYFAADLVPASGLTLIYLLAVLITAQRYGLRPALIVSTVSILVWDYFFTVPYYSLEISDKGDLFTLIIFLSASLLVSSTSSYIQYQNRQLSLLAEFKARLLEFGQKLAVAKSIDDISDISTTSILSMTGREASLFLRNGRDRETTEESSAPAQNFKADGHSWSELSAELHLSQLGETLIKRPIALFALTALRGVIGVIQVSGTLERPLNEDERRYIGAMADQIATALERNFLEREREATSIAAEAERIRNSLLISVSHDLRTPLTTIIGSLSTLELLDSFRDKPQQLELMSIAAFEAQRLDRFIGNLLDMTKLESGAIKASLSSVNIGDVVESVLERVEPLLQEHTIIVDGKGPLVPAWANFSLLEQAVFNVVDNAAKYSPPQSTIEIITSVEDGFVVIFVADEGTGIPEHFAQTIFQKFSRASLGDTKPPGTGLGLVIARGFLELMGGTIRAENKNTGPGAIFTIKVPATKKIEAQTSV